MKLLSSNFLLSPRFTPFLAARIHRLWPLFLTEDSFTFSLNASIDRSLCLSRSISPIHSREASPVPGMARTRRSLLANTGDIGKVYLGQETF